MSNELEEFNLTVSQGNDLIFSFMGLYMGNSVWSLHYHDDWNKLMEAGKKVREQVLKEQDVNTMKYWMAISVGLMTFDIDKVWKAIILYINYINTLKN